MIEALLDKLLAFAVSMPTNLVILLIICVIMKLSGKKWGDCISVVLIYLFAGLLLSMFGITMPSFIDIGRWIGGLFNKVTSAL